MLLKELILNGFRNYKKRKLELGEGTTVLIGENAVGKTNVLEAVYLLATGDSFKAGRIEEMVGFGEETGKVEAEIGGDKLTVVLTRGMLGERKVAKRRFLVNDVPKRKSDFAGILPAVIFRPEDLDLMDGSPSIRREFLDEVMCQADSEYGRSLASYQQALRRRNKILEAIREGVANRYQLTFWDGLLIRHGQRVSEGRENLINYINSIWAKSDLFSDLKVTYDRSLISEKRLAQYEKEEVMVAHTLVGPHKDDFLIMANGKAEQRDLSLYGSRGEKRMAILGLKMGELLFLEEKLGKKPLLLLDDIFSELDEKHSEEVKRVMIGRQVIVTTTEKNDVSDLKEAEIVNLP